MCRRKDILLPFFIIIIIIIFLSCNKEKTYWSDCFLYSLVPLCMELASLCLKGFGPRGPGAAMF